MVSLIEGHPEDSVAFMKRYRPPRLEEIDPSFIHMNPAVMEPSDFQPLEEYSEPVEPRVIDSFDYRAQAAVAIDAAEALIDNMRGDLEGRASLYDRIFDVMRAKRYRAGTVKQTRFEDNRALFRPTIESHIAQGTPLKFVLPSFPFKHKNPVKVGRRTPDMAEILCLSQLHEACHALSLIYEPGARFVIISDGLVYHHMFGVTRHEAMNYRERVKEMIGELGATDILQVTDMEDLVESRREAFDFVRSRLEPVFADWWRTHPDNLRRASLVSAAASNINTAESITHDLVQMATKDAVLGTDEEDTLGTFEKIKGNAVDRADEGAFEFALFLYVLKEIDLVRASFPRAVRATVHPKPTQWGLHLVNQESRVFPWQGVAYRKRGGQWRLKYEFEMRRKRAVPVHVRDDDEMFPFYYEDADATDGQ